jgi:thioredoxin reductase
MLLAQELVDNLMEQIAPFEAEFHLGQEVTVVKPVDDEFDIETSAGTRFRTKTVFLAGGVGSFQPRRMRLEGIEQYEDHSRASRSRSSAAVIRRSTGYWNCSRSYPR